MLLLAQALLRAAGFEYDEIDEAWVARSPLRPSASADCDEGPDYITEALREVRSILQAAGCAYNRFAIDGQRVSMTGPRSRSAA